MFWMMNGMGPHGCRRMHHRGYRPMGGLPLFPGVTLGGLVGLLALFAVRSARHGRSAYYSIAACAAMSMLLTQLAMNVFGSLDILPFTGVTFPFVSRGGSSLLSCWMLMAFLKGADNRRDASFAVRPGERLRSDPPAGKEAP